MKLSINRHEFNALRKAMHDHNDPNFYAGITQHSCCYIMREGDKYVLSFEQPDKEIRGYMYEEDPL